MRLHILKATLTIGTVFAVCAVVGGNGANPQQNPGIADCPNVLVSCPDDVEGNSDLHVYASVSGLGLKYHWTVTWPRGFRKGRIKYGQGTPSLVISVSGRARSLTVTVKVAGLDKACGNEASCTTTIARKL